MSELRDLGAYLERIGLDGPPTLANVHRAHATSIVFENFEPYAGRPVILELEHLEHKIVASRRGGYCFEQNLLFAGALRSLGMTAEPMLARVRRAGGSEPGPLNHLLLRVDDGNGTWLADVGFGGGGLLDPMPLGVGSESDQSGWRYRLVEDGPELVLQVYEDGAWADNYGFVPEPVPHVDIEVANWFTATRPDSIFVTNVFTGFRRPESNLTILLGETGVLLERPVGGATVTTEVDAADVPAILAERFELPGVRVGDDGRLTIDPPA